MLKTRRQKCNLFSRLPSDSIYDICKFLNALDVVFNVRLVCRATYHCINIYNQYDDDRFISLIDLNFKEFDEYLRQYVKLERLMNLKEREITKKETNVNKMERGRIQVRLLLRFKYIEMILKPKRDNHFMIRVSKTILDEFNPNQVDSDYVIEKFNEILRVFIRMPLYHKLYSELKHENDYVVLVGIVNRAIPYINELCSFKCGFKKSDPLTVSSNTNIRIEQRMKHEYSKYESGFKTFLEILDSLLINYSPRYDHKKSPRIIMMISQQDFLIPNRGLIINLNNASDYAFNDSQVNKFMGVSSKLYCHINPFKRELVYSSSALKEVISKKMFNLGVFCVVGIYLGLLLLFTNIPTFGFTREYFNVEPYTGSPWLYVLNDCVLGLSTLLYLIGIPDLKTVAIGMYALKWLSCVYYYKQSPLKILKLVHVPPLEIAHNVACSGFLGYLVPEIYSCLNALKTLFSYWKSSGKKND